MLFRYHLPGYDASSGLSDVMHKRHNDPDSLGLRKHVFEKRQSNCAGTVHNYPYLSYLAMHCYPGKGWKWERVSICGHPGHQADKQWVSDYNYILGTGMDKLGQNGLAVLELQIHNYQGYTFSNDRIVLETRDLNSCYEGEHLNAYCTK